MTPPMKRDSEPLSADGAVLAKVLGRGEGADRLLEAVAPGQVIAALGDALETFRSSSGPDKEAAREILIAVMDAGRRPAFLRKIYGSPAAAEWLGLVLQAIETADFTIGDLLMLRSRQSPDRELFQTPGGGSFTFVSRGALEKRTGSISRSILRMISQTSSRVPVAIFSPNRLETILTDLACLRSGIVDVPIAADATPDQVRFILEQTGPELLFVSDRQRLETILTGGPIPGIRRIILFDRPEDPGGLGEFRLFSEIEEEGRALPAVPRPRPRAADLATIMFTSGTTGRPKGIRFSHRNIIYKRYCRAVALPEIGEDDLFLCYLPLFHTFGRWLEMTGCVFWGAVYTMMDNPSVEAMLDAMRRHRPSVFISIPKRWIQLHERIHETAGISPGDPLGGDPVLLSEAVASVTGGRLRWGLSAAGHLDADIFQFFHRNGIELLSGFGMTEATGGITMTPPGRYRRGTVGVTLPGIEIRRGEDGELLCRGPYMMLGYDDPDEPPRDYEKEWFGTGDLVREDPDGYITIVDRKKDIYKNVKGQTIAPQRIENMFTEFEEIKRVFLVGDGREYNTLLIYPDPDAGGGRLRGLSRDDLRDYLSNFVVSVNRFLAPYERVVDFVLLPRYFREDRGELTPKGTFVRKVVEKNFKELIDGLYARSYVALHSEGIEIRVPTWLLREKGLTAEAIAADSGAIRFRPTGERLVVTRSGTAPGRVRVGTYVYSIESPDRAGPAVVDLDPILRVPRHWVGNSELAHFVGTERIRRTRRGYEEAGRISVEGWQRSVLLDDEIRHEFDEARRRDERGAAGVHAAAGLLLASHGDEARDAIQVLGRFFEDPTREEAVLVQGFLPLLRWHPEPEIRRRALAMLLSREADEGAAEILRRFLSVDAEVLQGELVDRLLSIELPAGAVRSFIHLARDLGTGSDPWTLTRGRRRVESLLRFVASIAASQPRWYTAVRQVLVRRAISDTDPEIVDCARYERKRLDESFRFWIASGVSQPIDPQTGEAISWDRILEFDERIDPALQERIARAVAETTFLRESIFLLGEQTLISGSDLLPGGIWVSPIHASGGCPGVRMIIRTRGARRFELAVRCGEGWSTEPVSKEVAAQEIDWLIRLGTQERGRRLVADVGGIWPEVGLWSEEYVADETVEGTLRRMLASADPDAADRVVALWPHLAWSALTSFIDFWQRTGRRFVLARPTTENIAIAPHDYQEGSRIMALTERREFSALAPMLRDLHERFVVDTERRYPMLRAGASRRVVFASLIEALGLEGAIPLLWRALIEMRDLAGSLADPEWTAWREDLAAYVDEIEREGYAPRRLVMSVRRYRTWERLNPGASLSARAMTLQELYETYNLAALEATHPEMRVRFFRMTVFADARPEIAAELDALIRAHRDTPLALDGLLRRMTILHRAASLTEDETYFLARLTYSHLRPTQRVHIEVLEEGGESTVEIVEEVSDDQGGRMRIRAAANPKEVIRLYRLFEHAGLSVAFRPEHRFLLALDEEETVAGGLFYRPAGRGTVHMEKIVVGPRHRGRALGEKLMESFLQRMRDDGQTSVTTGFFRPHYFYRFGFRLEKGFAGLVRDLQGTPERSG